MYKRQLFTYSLPDQEAVLVNGRLAVIGELPRLPEEPQKTSVTTVGQSKQRHIYLAGWQDVLVFDLESLSPGATVSGPAIIESATTTIVLRKGDEAVITSNLWLDISVER